MGASQTPPRPATGASSGGNPSMEDILASIRAILRQDEAQSMAASPPPASPVGDDVLVLDPAMMVPEPNASPAAPVADPSRLVAPEVAAAASASVEGLVRTLKEERAVRASAGGPTIEDVVREELRPLLKDWLDCNLPPLVERLVRAEIERVVGRAVP